MSEWISVKDRMPEIRVDVLACDSYGDIGFGYFFLGYQDKICFSDRSESLGNVTHWMPLPPPAEGE